MKVSSLQLNTGNDIIYSKAFKQIIEDHISYLKTHFTTNLIPLNKQIEEKYFGDFYGLLIENNIPCYMHWIILRLNNLKNSNEYNSNLNFLLTIPENTARLLLLKHINTISSY